MLDLAINPWGITGVAAVATAWSFAVFLLRNTERTPTINWFVSVLFIEGFVLVTSSSGITFFLDVPFPRIMSLFHAIGDALLLFAYPVFIAHALPRQSLASLTRKPGILISALVAMLAFTLTILTPYFFLGLFLIAMFSTSLFLAIHSIKLAKTKLAKKRAIVFAVAFGLRDVTWGTVYLLSILGAINSSQVVSFFVTQTYTGSTLLYVPLVVYGILSSQLLDIQLQIRRTVKGGTLAALFVAFFFLVSEAAAMYFSDLFGDILGLIMAATLVFLVAPLQRMVDWVSSSLVQVNESSEYSAYRKLAIYSAGIEDALAYGAIGPSQRALLERLKSTLEVSDKDAAQIESDLSNQLGSTSSLQSNLTLDSKE